ncbi:hypothetical protein, partial [Streptomyces sp. NPDC059757]|uniref:hypothetical protein n=1 Tax=Streptomyces sp. NPDC059757 TaxID=3346935 RepID=UPI00364624B1
MASKMVEAVLFSGIDVRVERVSTFTDVLLVEAVSIASPGRCPDCRLSGLGYPLFAHVERHRDNDLGAGLVVDSDHV